MPETIAESVDTVRETLSFYDATAESYVVRTRALDMTPERQRFLAHLQTGCAVLDAGCGSGRDALAFHQAGLAVTAFDGSARMVELARANTDFPVEHRTFAQMDWLAAFDGVWACASLLHLPPRPLNDALRSVHRALRPQGVFYTSFKHGVGPRRDAQGRYFLDFTGNRLSEYLAFLGFRVGEVWFTSHKSDPTARWVNVLAFRSDV